MMESTKLSIGARNCNKSSQSHDYMWDNAIRDADEEIRSLNRKLTRLKQAIRIFKENK